MYSRRKRYILRTVLIYFFNIDFQRSKGGSIFLKKIETLDVSRLEYIQCQNVARVVLKVFITMIMITLLLQEVDKM